MQPPGFKGEKKSFKNGLFPVLKETQEKQIHGGYASKLALESPCKANMPLS